MNARQRKKQPKIKNKALIKKYPWLMPRNVWTGKIDKDYDYHFTLYDEIPDGWAKCFGKMMIEEMDKASGGNIFIVQIKEKYGQLRIYANANKETQDIISKYGYISENVCMKCGKPDVYMTGAGWYYPCCKKCWEKNKYNTRPYEEVIDTEHDAGRMVDSYKYTKFSKEGNITVEVDISDTVARIRKKYGVK